LFEYVCHVTLFPQGWSPYIIKHVFPYHRRSRRVLVSSYIHKGCEKHVLQRCVMSLLRDVLLKESESNLVMCFCRFTIHVCQVATRTSGHEVCSEILVNDQNPTMNKTTAALYSLDTVSLCVFCLVVLSSDDSFLTTVRQTPRESIHLENASG